MNKIQEILLAEKALSSVMEHKVVVEGVEVSEFSLMVKDTFVKGKLDVSKLKPTLILAYAQMLKPKFTPGCVDLASLNKPAEVKPKPIKQKIVRPKVATVVSATPSATKVVEPKPTIAVKTATVVVQPTDQPKATIVTAKPVEKPVEKPEQKSVTIKAKVKHDTSSSINHKVINYQVAHAAAQLMLSLCALLDEDTLEGADDRRSTAASLRDAYVAIAQASMQAATSNIL